MKTRIAATATALGLLFAAGTAQATIVILPASQQPGGFLPTFGAFSEILPTLDGVNHANLAGVYGVELRRGNNAGNGDWEIGVGQATSNIGAGNFNQGQYRWASNTTTTIANGGGTETGFSISWVPAATLANPTGLVATLGANGLNANPVTVSSPGGSRSAFLGGNTLKVYLKRDTRVTITSIDGQLFNTSIIGNPTGAGTPLSEFFFYSDDNWGGDGFTVTGTIRMSGANGGSGNGALFKSGNYVPEPATWAMLIAGLGFTGTAMRRRNRARIVSA